MLEGEAYNKRECLKKSVRYVHEQEEISKKDLVLEMSVGFNMTKKKAREWLTALIETERLEVEIIEQNKNKLVVTEKGLQFIGEV